MAVGYFAHSIHYFYEVKSAKFGLDFPPQPPLSRTCERSVSGEKAAPHSNLYISVTPAPRSATMQFAVYTLAVSYLA